METNKWARRFLLLDKENILNVCGSLSRQELFKLVGIASNHALECWLTNYGILDNKYYVIEDI